MSQPLGCDFPLVKVQVCVNYFGSVPLPSKKRLCAKTTSPEANLTNLKHISPETTLENVKESIDA